MEKADTRPPALREACKTPGKYLFRGSGLFFIEVAQDGVVYQLTFQFERDGVLGNGGWDLKPDTQRAELYLLTQVVPPITN